MVATALSTAAANTQIDLTGEWANRYSEDAPHRGAGPALGDYAGLPLNDAARFKAEAWNASVLSTHERQCIPHVVTYALRPLNSEGRRGLEPWDPAQASSNGCKAFGAAAIMRVPGRLHITWEGDDALKIETDAGRQTRLLRFTRAHRPGGDRTWQGDFIAKWLMVGPGRRGEPPAVRDGSLQVVTTSMRAGYYLSNGVP